MKTINPSYVGVINALDTEKWTPWSILLKKLFTQNDTSVLRLELSEKLSHLITLGLVSMDHLTQQENNASQLQFKKRPHIKRQEIPRIYLPK